MFSFCISFYWIPNFFISANFGIATHSEAGYAAHQVEGYTEQERPRNIVELVRDNNFDTLSEHDKYIVLKNRFVPEANFDFPKTIKHGWNRSYKTAYLSDSFVYSCLDNAVYCIYCVLFVPKYRRNILGAFAYRGYREWHSIMEKEKKHSKYLSPGSNYCCPCNNRKVR